MRNLLLMGVFALGVSALAAETPYLVEGTNNNQFKNYRLSPNGLYCAGYIDLEHVGILTLETQEITKYQKNYGSLGQGNCIADDGSTIINVGKSSDPSAMTPAVLKTDGSLYLLPESKGYLGTAITADGSRITGYYWNTGNNQKAPVYWNLLEDGSYSDPIDLPLPEKDVTGNQPQRVMALSINNSGDLIAGILISGSGIFNYPIIYNFQEDGTWDFVAPTLSFFADSVKDLPEEPEDVNYADFMNEKEIAGYIQALETWQKENENKENPDETTFPNPADYMTEGERADYEAAMEKYDEEITAYYEAWKKAIVDFPSFSPEFFALDPTGQFLALTQQSDDQDKNQTNYTTWLFDLAESGNFGENNYIKVEDDRAIYVNQVLSNATIIGSFDSQAYGVSYFATPENPKFVTATEYLTDYSQWMTENLTKRVNVGTMFNPDEKSMVVSGWISVTDDLSTIIGGYGVQFGYYSFYVLCDTPYEAGIPSLPVNREIKEGIYNLKGVKINPTSLSKGLYIMNGKKVVVR